MQHSDVSATHSPIKHEGLWAQEQFANHHFGKPPSTQQEEEAEAGNWGAGLWVSVSPALIVLLGA